MSAGTTTTTMLDAALDYAERGVPVFPVWGVRDGRCRCGSAACDNQGKHPLGALVPRGLKDASSDPQIIQGWWTRYPDANIATPTGWCLVLDVDPRHARPRMALGCCRLRLLKLPPGDVLNRTQPSCLASAGRLSLCGCCGRLLVGCCDSI